MRSLPRNARAAFRAVLLCIVCLVSSIGSPGNRALACSAGPDWDPIAESEIIVEGRITGWTERHDLNTQPGSFIPVEMTVRVERVFKGNPAPEITFVDGASYTRGANNAGQNRWAGGGGACGTFDVDPTGATVILGLNRGEAGELRSHRLRSFYVGFDVSEEWYDSVIERD